jgi:hypothetical protein
MRVMPSKRSAGREIRNLREGRHLLLRALASRRADLDRVATAGPPRR